jgi:hypothetical protein
MCDVMAQACVRFATHGGAVKARVDQADRMRRVDPRGAWTDAVPALVELELPQWKLRRLPTARAFLSRCTIAPLEPNGPGGAGHDLAVNEPETRGAGPAVPWRSDSAGEHAAASWPKRHHQKPARRRQELSGTIAQCLDLEDEIHHSRSQTTTRPFRLIS